MLDSVTLKLTKTAPKGPTEDVTVDCAVTIPFGSDGPDPASEDFQKRLRVAFDACHRACEEEIFRQRQQGVSRLRAESPAPDAKGPRQVSPATSPSLQVPPPRVIGADRSGPIEDGQAYAILKLAFEKRADLHALLRKVYGIDSLDELNWATAMALIEQLSMATTN